MDKKINQESAFNQQTSKPSHQKPCYQMNKHRLHLDEDLETIRSISSKAS